MHLHVRSLALLALLAPATVLAWQVSSSGVDAQVPPAAPCVVFPGAAQAPGVQAPGDSARSRVIQVVTIRDNNAPSPLDAFDRRQSRWDYDPAQLVVRRGELVEFRNARTDHEHTVTSYIRPGGPAATTLAVGTLFDSSPPPSTTRIPVGGSCILDTGAIPLPPNPQGGLSQNIGYFCRLHPWMNAEITIVAPPN